ncbi:MAG: hypothetical protein WC511_03465 [Candidatus Pacearchaeota archaeon]
MEFYVDCYDCKDLNKGGKKNPDTCKSEKAMKYYNPKSGILFCSDVNLNHDCKYVKLKFGALVRKAFEDRD